MDCGSLVPTLIESELFGYVKGAFTGANQTKDGLLAMAKAERYFSMKSGRFPSTCRPRCCARYRKKKFVPVGSTRRIPINVRILAATNRDFEQAVMQGEFRRDCIFV